ncbi:MAG: NAD-dependent epimerase/dehydratase family protein [Candidatus Nanohaloarchaea archaeon]
MELLVAGNGFIGSALEERLEDHDVDTLGLEDADIEQDVTEEFELEKSYDVLFHCIGLAPGFNSPEEYQEVHVDGTRNLLDAVQADKVVYLSALGTGENDYSFFHTKRQAESLVRDRADRWTIIRPSTVYGPGNQLLEMIRSFSLTRMFPRIPAETQPIHIDDLAELLEISIDGLGQETVNAAGPEPVTISRMAKKIYREEGRRCMVIPVPLPVTRAMMRLMDPLPVPFGKELLPVLEMSNTTDENHAADHLELTKIF